MDKHYITRVAEDIDTFGFARESYRKRFLLASASMCNTQRKKAQKLFAAIDRQRNRIKFSLRALASNRRKPAEEQMRVIEKGRADIQMRFQQLDNVLC